MTEPTQADYQEQAAAARRLHARRAEHWRKRFEEAPLIKGGPLTRPNLRPITPASITTPQLPGRPRTAPKPPRKPDSPTGLRNDAVTPASIKALMDAGKGIAEVAQHFHCSTDLIYRRLRIERGTPMAKHGYKAQERAERRKGSGARGKAPKSLLGHGVAQNGASGEGGGCAEDNPAQT